MCLGRSSLLDEALVSRAVVAEVIGRVGINSHVVGFDMTNDGHVVVLLCEHAVDPFAPGNGLEVHFDANFCQRCCNEFAGVGCISNWRQVQVDRETIGVTGRLEQRFRLVDVVWVEGREVFVPRVGWGNEAANLEAVTRPGRLDEILLVDRLANGLAHQLVVEWRTSIVHAKRYFAVGAAAIHGQVLLCLKHSKQLWCLHRGHDVDLPGKHCVA